MKIGKLVAECLEDTAYHVCLTEYGITSCCFVSSAHLIEAKEAQLRQSIQKKALDAFS
jgi:hypothetical protein